MTEEKSFGESYILICILKNLYRKVVNIRVLGDWMFTGRLVKVEHELALLTDVTVTSGAGLTLSTFEVDHVVVNLETIASVGKPSFVTDD